MQSMDAANRFIVLLVVEADLIIIFCTLDSIDVGLMIGRIVLCSLCTRHSRRNTIIILLLFVGKCTKFSLMHTDRKGIN